MNKVDMINSCEECSHSAGYSLHTSWCNKLDKEVNDDSIDQNCPLTNWPTVHRIQIREIGNEIDDAISPENLERFLHSIGVKIEGE